MGVRTADEEQDAKDRHQGRVQAADGNGPAVLFACRCGPRCEGVGMRLILHGVAVSNYANTVQAALIEKGARYQFVPTPPSQAAEFLDRSPMGKIPWLDTPHGCIGETIAMLEYFEEVLPGPALLPVDPFARARARQLFNILQVYVEVPMHALFVGSFIGGDLSSAAVAETRPMLERALGAITRLASFDDFMLGRELSFVDLFGFYTFDIVRRLADFVYDWRILDSIDGLARWHAMMAERSSSRALLADFTPAFQAYLDNKGGRYRDPAAAGKAVHA